MQSISAGLASAIQQSTNDEVKDFTAARAAVMLPVENALASVIPLAKLATAGTTRSVTGGHAT